MRFLIALFLVLSLVGCSQGPEAYVFKSDNAMVSYMQDGFVEVAFGLEADEHTSIVEVFRGSFEYDFKNGVLKAYDRRTKREIELKIYQ